MKSNGKFRHTFNFLFVLALLLGIGLACSEPEGENRSAPNRENGKTTSGKKAEESDNAPRRLESYTVRGFKFSYYLIPAGLSREELIATAQQLHDREPDAQLVLVDDEAGLADYIRYAQEVSRGNMEAEFPKEWADRHIVANVQKYMSGKFKLCASYGSNEIAELQ